MIVRGDQPPPFPVELQHPGQIADVDDPAAILGEAPVFGATLDVIYGEAADQAVADLRRRRRNGRHRESGEEQGKTSAGRAIMNPATGRMVVC